MDSSNSISIYVDSLPKGSVIMWYGDPDNVPNGWVLCDDSDNSQKKGAPNLKGRFPIGASDEIISDNSLYARSLKIGRYKDGFDTRIMLNNIPEHSHTAKVSENGNHKHNIGMRGATVNVTQGYVYGGSDSGKATSEFVDEAGSHTHSVTIGNTGKGEAFNVIPPYFALHFIYKYQ